MPVVDLGSEVLVTGANGYISMWVISLSLHVRGAVRSNERKCLREYFRSYGAKVAWVVVEDHESDGAFDEAVKGVDGIEKMASPLNPPSDDPDDYITPAVRVTVGIFQSALRAGVVVWPPRTFDESDWGDEYMTGVKEQGKKSPKISPSKTWPRKLPLQEEKMPTDLNFSLEVWYNMIFKEQPGAVLASTHGYMLVRGVAAILVASLSNEVAAGEGIILFPGDVIYSLKYHMSGILPRGTPDLGMILAWNTRT
ncbi:hypothetical protein BDZ97DRAFT_1763982 [Flammula alnicola]|nr:hypothetical protein BDZ97DRAFT_1763982 [Flammula alnicola]